MQNVWLIITKKVYDSYTNIDSILLLLWLYTLGMNRKILSDYEIGFPSSCFIGFEYIMGWNCHDMIMWACMGVFLVKGCDVAMIMGLMLGAYMYMRFWFYSLFSSL